MSVEMSEKEISELLNSEKVGTLLLVDKDRPYGIVCWFIYDGKNVRIGIIPAGRKFECIKDNSNAAFSVWNVSGGWRSVFAEGRIRQITEYGEMKESLELAGKRYNVPWSYLERQLIAAKNAPEKSMSFIIETENISGRKSG